MGGFSVYGQLARCESPVTMACHCTHVCLGGRGSESAVSGAWQVWWSRRKTWSPHQSDLPCRVMSGKVFSTPAVIKILLCWFLQSYVVFEQLRECCSASVLVELCYLCLKHSFLGKYSYLCNLRIT